jgi:2-polyprenyl-6-methoxyphenol hydroxylase-like FAD-dependent oxidoreductase
MYDLIIIGGGPGGVAAGIYAARKKMKTVLVTDSFGGQSLVSAALRIGSAQKIFLVLTSRRHWKSIFSRRAALISLMMILWRP